MPLLFPLEFFFSFTKQIFVFINEYEGQLLICAWRRPEGPWAEQGLLVYLLWVFLCIGTPQENAAEDKEPHVWKMQMFYLSLFKVMVVFDIFLHRLYEMP